MPYYRIYKYENSVVPYKHVLIKRDREVISDKASDNANRINSMVSNIEKQSVNLSRAKRCITDLILCNSWDYFCTFTFKPSKVNRYDLDECYRVIRRFFNNYRTKKSPTFTYLIVPEFHKDGAIHFHGVVKNINDSDLIIPDKILKCNINSGEYELVPNTKRYLRWVQYDKNLGIFNCSPIMSAHATAFYMTKYITKGMGEMPFGTHLYTCSKNLNRPELIVDEDEMVMMITPTFENDFCAVAFDKYEQTEYIKETLGLSCPWGDCIPAEWQKGREDVEAEKEQELFEYVQLRFPK